MSNKNSIYLILFVAWRYFLAKKGEKFVSFISFISLIGITIGVAALIVVMAVMNGFHLEFSNHIIGLNGDLSIRPIDKTITNYESIISKLHQNVAVKNVAPIIFGQALAIGKKSSSGAIIKSMDLDAVTQKGEITKNVLSGSFSDYIGTSAIAIGSGLSANIGAHVGSKVKMVAPNFISTAFGTMPRAKDFTVVAIFNSGLWEYDSATILMPLEAGKIFLSSQINLIEVKLESSNEVEKYMHYFQQDFGDIVEVSSWKHNNKQFLKALEVERVAMFAILSLIILVAAFNILSGLFMIVKDKTKDIAILKTIGASTWQIMSIFIVNGMIVGGFGTVLGLVLGLLLAKNIESIRMFLENISDTTIFDPAIYFLYSLPSKVETEDVLFVAVMSLALSFLATIYPAFKASSLNPVEAMRYE